jgi:D-glycero-alpha-D-manno-heptose-7-phosphate kinase
MGLGNIHGILQNQPVSASAPCRLDFGGTLDISSFHYPMRTLAPCTVNLSLDLRTTVQLTANSDDRIRISSAGFDDAAFDAGQAPYDHPLGLMFAVTDYFGATGVHIDIHSTSPPKSGLGGSSVAAVALIAAYSKVLEIKKRSPLSREQMVLLAHAIEQGVAGALCGFQDHLAAAFGGVNRWNWPAVPGRPPYVRHPLLDEAAVVRLNPHLLVAYLGITHVSKDVNSTWVRQFIGSHSRQQWHEIIFLTTAFADAIARWDMRAAAEAMIRETAIRKTMTPHVLDSMGDRLAAAATEATCGARFTGAGGGGCLWAIGETDAIAALRPIWETLLADRSTAALLDCRLDDRGVI